MIYTDNTQRLRSRRERLKFFERTIEMKTSLIILSSGIDSQDLDEFLRIDLWGQTLRDYESNRNSQLLRLIINPINGYSAYYLEDAEDSDPTPVFESDNDGDLPDHLLEWYKEWRIAFLRILSDVYEEEMKLPKPQRDQVKMKEIFDTIKFLVEEKRNEIQERRRQWKL